MKLKADRFDGPNAIARHGPEGVIVNGIEYRHSVIVPWSGEVRRWPPRDLPELAEAHFAALSELEPELVIFGSGPRLKFADPALLRTLYAQHIGVETMDSAAACRTYNILLAEGRSVVAALIF